MIIQELRTGEKRYTKIQVVFEVSRVKLLKVLTRYGSQQKWNTRYRFVF